MNYELITTTIRAVIRLAITLGSIRMSRGADL